MKRRATIMAFVIVIVSGCATSIPEIRYRTLLLSGFAICS